MSKRFILSLLSNPLAQRKWTLIFAPLLMIGDWSFPKWTVPKAGELFPKFLPRSGTRCNRSWKGKYIWKNAIMYETLVWKKTYSFDWPWMQGRGFEQFPLIPGVIFLTLGIHNQIYVAKKTATSAFQRLVWRARSVPTTTLVVKAGMVLQQR